MKNINSAHRRDIRATICATAHGRCAYCRRPIGDAGTVDHYLPQAAKEAPGIEFFAAREGMEVQL